MPDYQHGKIYKITVGPYFYIGSTTSSLNQRIANHKQDIHRKSKLYEKMREIGSCEISLVEEYACTNRLELSRREEEILAEHWGKPECLNMRRAFCPRGQKIDGPKMCLPDQPCSTS